MEHIKRLRLLHFLMDDLLAKTAHREGGKMLKEAYQKLETDKEKNEFLAIIFKDKEKKEV